MFKKARVHEGKAWAERLKAYDKYAAEHFGDHQAVDLESRFGSTRAYLCGNPENPSIMILHGLMSCSLDMVYLLPALVQNYYLIFVDRMGEVGRTRPVDGLNSNLPKGKAETIEWFLFVKKELGLLGKPVSLIGHSYGSFLSSLFAKSQPQEVHRVFLTAPAATFEKLNTDGYWHIVFEMQYYIRRLLPTKMAKRFWTSTMTMATDCDAETLPMWDLILTLAKTTPNSVVTAGKPHKWSIAELKEINRKTPVFLLVGGKDTGTNPIKSMENAKKAGIPSKMYLEAPHNINIGHEDQIIKDAIDFFEGKKVEGATYPGEDL